MLHPTFRFRTAITPNGYPVVYPCTFEQFPYLTTWERENIYSRALEEVRYMDNLKEQLSDIGFILEVDRLYI